MLSYNAAFTAATDKSYADKAGWIIQLYYNEDTDFHIFGTRWVSLTDDNVYGNVVSVSDIVSSVDPHDCSYSVSNCTVRFAEGVIGTATNPIATMAELLDLQAKEYRNRTFVLKRYAGGTGLTQLSDFTTEFYGTVLDYAYDKLNEQWVFEIVARGELRHKDLPSTIVTKVGYPNAPDESFGMRIPLVYGRFVNNQANEYDYENNIYNYAPSVCTNKKGEFTFADHALKQFNTFAGIEQVAYYLTGLKNYGQEVVGYDGTTAVLTTQDASLATVVLPAESGTKYLKFRRCYITLSREGKDHTSGFSDISDLIDNDNSTYLTIDASLLGSEKCLLRCSGITDTVQFLKVATAGQINITARISSYSASGVTRCFVVWNNPDYALGGGGTITYVNLQNINGNGTFGGNTGTPNDNTSGPNYTMRTDNQANGTPINSTTSTLTTQWSFEELGRCEFGVVVPAASSDSFRLHWISLLIKDLIIAGSEPLYKKSYTRKSYRDFGQKKSGNNTKPPWWSGWVTQTTESIEVIGDDVVPATSGIFAEIDGREVGATIGGRAGNTLAPTDVNYLSGFVIESILRDELGFGNNDINEASFDDVTESDWYGLGFSLNEVINSKELIAELSFNSRSITCQTSDGQWKIFRFSDNPFVGVGQNPVEYSRIKFLDYRWSSPSLLCNDVTVNYAFEYADGTYKRKATSSDATSKGDTYQGQNRTTKKTIDCPYIRYSTESGATDYGQALADFYVAQWKDPHLIIEFETDWLPYFAFQELDCISFDLVPEKFNDSNINPFGLGTGGVNTIMNSFATPRSINFLIIKCVRSLEKCVFTCFQLHEF